MLMIAVLMLSCAASCGGSTPEAPDTQNPSQITESNTEETTDGRVMDNLSDEDFGEYTFRIQANIAGNATLWAFPEEQTGDLLNDAYYKRNQQVSERFNVIFEETYDGDGHSLRIIQANVMAGDDSYDLYQLWDKTAIAAAENDLIYSMYDLPDVDLTKPYWSDINEMLTIGGHQYFAVGDHDPVLLTGLCALFVNKDMAEDLGIGKNTMYDLVRQGKWTTDVFFKYANSAISDVNGNTKVDEDDIFGITLHRYNYFMDFFTVNGARIVDKDEEDMPYLSVIGNSRFADIYDMLLTNTFSDPALIWNTYNTDFTGAEYMAQSDKFVRALMHFGNGRSLFCGVTLSRAPALRSYDLDYGILPYPKVEEVPAGTPYIGRIDSLVPYVVPKTNSDLHRTGVLLEALACAGHNEVVPVYHELVLGAKETRDEDSIEMLNMMFENRTVELERIYWSTTVLERLCESNTQGFASQLASIESELNRRLETTIETFEKLANQE